MIFLSRSFDIRLIFPFGRQRIFQKIISIDCFFLCQSYIRISPIPEATIISPPVVLILQRCGFKEPLIKSLGFNIIQLVMPKSRYRFSLDLFAYKAFDLVLLSFPIQPINRQQGIDLFPLLSQENSFSLEFCFLFNLFSGYKSQQLDFL